jgi:hypothetical protein
LQTGHQYRAASFLKERSCNFPVDRDNGKNMIHGLNLSSPSGQSEFFAQQFYVDLKSGEKAEQIFIQKVTIQPIL